jgi:hypothetical protein
MPYEKQAMRGDPMPEGMDYPDQILYLSLSLLYARYRMKQITREQASKEKNMLLDEYEMYKKNWKMADEWCLIIKATEAARAEFRKNPSIENGYNVIEAIEGRKK